MRSLRFVNEFYFALTHVSENITQLKTEKVDKLYMCLICNLSSEDE